jgi:hypothetical protein
MNGYDITLTVIILLVFVILFVAPILSVGIQQVKDNWVKYRCNPVVMPFAGLFGHDPTSTFTFCIQTMLKEFMGFMMIPLQHSMNLMSSMGGDFETAINDVRKMMSGMRSMVTEIVQSIFGVFLNILVEIQKMTIKIKDMMGKLIGIMTSLMFMVYGSMQAMQSAWNGPPGQLTRALCFEPSTIIQLYSGEMREIKDIDTGDILKDGSIVEGVLKLKNTVRELFYSISDGEEGRDIKVTGSHMIKNNEREFVPVRDHPESKLTKEEGETLYSLMTSTNRIPIGKRIFWDWNDDTIVAKYIHKF